MLCSGALCGQGVLTAAGCVVCLCGVVQPVVGRPTRKDFTKDLPFIGYTYKSFDAVNRMTELPM